MARTVSFALGALLLLTSCARRELTQVIVTVDAEPGVANLSRSTWIRIWGRGPAETRFDDEVFLEEVADRYPWNVALRPREDDAARIFRVEATAYAGEFDPGNLDAGGAAIARARVTSSYVEGEVLYIYVLLQDSCIGELCDESLDQTCRNGRCESAEGGGTRFDPDAGLPDAGRPTCTDPGDEVCNRSDDDCDGRVDEGTAFRTDARHCGGCGNSCDAPNATSECVDARCERTCETGWLDCTPDPGCETQVSSRSHCGGCGNACPSGQLCQASGGTASCVSECTGGTVECDGSCVDLATDEGHCGACGEACGSPPNASAECEGGACRYACDENFDDCDADLGAVGNGCEQSVSDDVLNCGACGTMCPRSGSPCRSRSCTAGSCGFVSNDGATCDDGDPTTCSDRCAAMMCRGTPCGMDAGGGTDGGTCGGPMASCGRAADCCDGVCCNSSCCDMGQVCVGGSFCDFPDAGTDGGVSCPGGSTSCSGAAGSACCTAIETCCDGICCPSGDVCMGAGVCVPDDGGVDGGSCGSGEFFCSDFAGGGTCCLTGQTCCDGMCCAMDETCNVGICDPIDAGFDGGDGSACALLSEFCMDSIECCSGCCDGGSCIEPDSGMCVGVGAP